jgi:hypothetical protein
MLAGLGTAMVGQVVVGRLVGAASRTVVLGATVMRARVTAAPAVVAGATRAEDTAAQAEDTAAQAVDTAAQAVGTAAQAVGTAAQAVGTAMYTSMHTAQAPLISRFAGMSPASWRLSFSRLSRSGLLWAGRSAARTSLLR